jgi:hypothetical protein
VQPGRGIPQHADLHCRIMAVSRPCCIVVHILQRANRQHSATWRCDPARMEAWMRPCRACGAGGVLSGEHSSFWGRPGGCAETRRGHAASAGFLAGDPIGVLGSE